MSQPPSYRSNSEELRDDEPPAYETIITEAYAPEETPTLILGGCTIYSEANPTRPLYETSNPVCEPSLCPIYGVQKYRYRVRDIGGEPRLRTRLDHIYDFKSDWTTLGDRDVILVPKASKKRIHHDVKMSMTTSVTSYKIRGHFKVERSLMDRLTKGVELEWKDSKGNLMAVETGPERDDEGILLAKPKLDVRVKLDEKDLDLLATCWLARVWKQSEKDLAKPMTWEEFKAKASQKVARDSTARTGSAL